MKTIKYAIYMVLMLLTTGVVHAAPTATVNPLSTAMFIYIPSALLAILVTYYIWRMNSIKRRQNAPKTTNRGPVRRPMVAYQRRKALHDAA
jgi:hypothetical protein